MAVQATDASDTAQTITALTAHVANHRGALFETEGQRTLFLVEELLAANVLPATATREEATAMGVAMGAHIALKIPRQRDIKRVVLVVRASIKGDLIAKKAVNGLRSGKRKSGEAAYSYWKRASKFARGESPTKRKKKVFQFMPRGMKLSPKDRAWVFSEAKKIKKAFETSGQRSLAMNRALIERDLASLSKSGGPMSQLRIRRLVSKELGTNHQELAAGMTILRREVTGEITPGAIEAIESGHYESCRHVARTLTGRGRRASIEEAKSQEWLRSKAMAVASNRTLLMPAQRVLAYFETMIEHRVLDPLVQVSRHMKTVSTVAVKWIPDASMREVEACWSMIRAIARKDLSPNALDGVRAGVATAATLTSSRAGGILGLAKTLKGRANVVKADHVRREAVELVDLRVADVPSDTDDLVEDVADPIAAFHDFTSDAGGLLNRIIAAAEKLKDREHRELVTLTRRFREQVGFCKMQANKLRNRWSVTQGRTK